MNEVNLSKRLKTVADYVSEHARMADIGSDHAYLPAYLAKLNKIDYCIAGEVVEGPLENAKKEIQKTHTESIIIPRLGDGLSVIKKADQLNTIVIAGMGGSLIRDILNRGISHLSGQEKLILQPNVGEKTLRKWLVEHQYVITDEKILKENQHIYEIIVAANKQQSVKLSEMDLMFGPYLRKQKSVVFLEKWHQELHRKQLVLQNIEQNGRGNINEQLTKLKHEIKLIQDVL